MKNFDVPRAAINLSLLQLLMIATLFPFQLSALHKVDNSNDNSSIATVGGVEICDNRIDDDGDGLIDCMDPDCSGDVSCWECITEFYQVHSNQYLVSLDPVSGTYTNLANISGATAVNGAQFNPVDGHVYAPSTIDGEHVLGMLYEDGSVVSTGLDLPGSGIFYVGAIDAAGTMYVTNAGDIYSIDLGSENLEVVNTGVSGVGVADFSLDITNGLFYGIDGNSRLKVFDPYSLQVASYNLGGSINNETGGFGAAWSCNDGSFFAYNNSSGKIYSIDTQTLTSTFVLNATGNLSINDGFNCVLAPPPFETNCTNGIDDDGDGLIDCNDPDCVASNECTIEICDNGIDDDGDGWIDCSDTECYNLSFCLEICDNGIDDNGNGLIDSDDPQCSTSSGVTGGLESNRRLSDKIAKRNFSIRVLHQEEVNQKLRGDIPFASNAVRSDRDIASYIPQELYDAYVAESTPLDLIDITNATDVAAADYYIEDQRIASVLGIYSEEGVYEHSKYICDRLDGSRLLDISYLFAKGGNFISYELLNKYGQAEYAVSFSAHLVEGQGFEIENHWNLHKYNSEKNYYNFQVWSSSYVELIILLEDILGKMDQSEGITSIVNTEIPTTFVMYGNYENGALALQVRNKNQEAQLEFSAAIRRHENGEIEQLEQSVPLSGAAQETILLETGHLYDLGASLNFENSPSDEIFLADGMWGVDAQDENGIVDYFETAEDARLSTSEEYQIERSIEISGTVKNYINVFRSLDAKFKPYNVNQYNSLVLSATGNRDIEVTIVKSSIDKWEEQFRTTIELNDIERVHDLHKSQFRSSAYSDLSFDDVTSIVFSVVGDGNRLSEFEFSISEVSFMNVNSTSNTNVNTGGDFSLGPNPVYDILNIEIDNIWSNNYDLTITNLVGVVVSRQELSLTTSKSIEQVDVSHLTQGCYFVCMVDKSGSKRTGKFVKVD